MRNLVLIIFLFPLALSAQFKPYKGPYGVEDLDKVPPAPDYTQMKYWIAHPDKEDMADVVPGKGEIAEYQSTARVDVFFVYPTIYTRKQHKDHPWFADVNDEHLNARIARSTIRNQATVFNSVGAIYSPLYRQAHYGAFFTDSTVTVPALDLAYQDVKKAFEYYLEHFNNGRPVIIASHSQGTVHAARLLKEFFDGKKRMEQLVAAYIIGIPVQKNYFTSIEPCESKDQTSCWITWNTYARDYYPSHHKTHLVGALSVNPLTWTTDATYASFGENRGGVLRNFKKIRAGLVDAQNHEGMIWINKPRFFGNFLLRWKRYHIIDYNLFYMNIRENAELRVDEYFNKMKLTRKMATEK